MHDWRDLQLKVGSKRQFCQKQHTIYKTTATVQENLDRKTKTVYRISQHNVNRKVSEENL